MHVYTPQYPESILERVRIPLTIKPKGVKRWLEMLADNAVVDQSTVAVSAAVLSTVHCRVVLWPS